MAASPLDERYRMGLRIPLVRRRPSLQVQRQLPVAKIDEWFHTAHRYELEGHGFEQVGRRRWIRSAKAPIREGIQIHAIKGYSFMPVWFLSLDPVPHVTGTGQVKWHRTAASARPDLLVDAFDEPDAYDVDGLVVSGMQTAAEAKEAIRGSTRLAVGYATSWFDRVSDLPSLISLYEEARSRPVVRFGVDNYTQHRLSFAFVLKAAGYDVLAVEEFDLWAERCGREMPADAIAQLRGHLHALPRAG
ncbi:MAG: hypothetical protein ACRDKT_11905 [Actinomycetota bacterium]